MVYINCARRDNILVMRFNGKMTVDAAGKIKKGLLQLCSQTVSAYHADFSGITDVDISFLQLLIAFNIKIKKKNSQLFILKNRISEQMLNDLNILGINISSHFLVAEGDNESTGK